MTPAAALSARGGTPSDSRGRLSGDAVSLLSVYLVLLVALPSQFVVPGLGGAGSPALLVGVGCLACWLFLKVQRGRRDDGRQPVLWGVAALASCIALSYVAACVRPTNAAELQTATLGLISVAGWFGVLLLAHDGLVDRRRLQVLLGRLTLAGGLLAAFGLLQFVTHRSWVDELSVPGLTLNGSLYGVQDRDGFTRPAGTAVHPIEFGAVLAMLLPIAVARVGTAPAGRRLGRAVAPAVILLAVILSSSRSALVTAFVGVVVLVPALERRERRLVVGGAALAGVAVFVLVPGMLGTMLGLFGGIDSDTSAQSRLDSYGVAWQYLQHVGPFGRGLATFFPRYHIFDNEYVLLLIEIGVCGVLALLSLLGLSVLTGLRTVHTAIDPAARLEMQGVVGAVVAGGASLALFDALSFPMVPGFLFLMVGLVGGLRRVLHRRLPESI